MKISSQILITWFFLSHFTTIAQQMWTLKMCVDTAYKNNISINQAQLNSRIDHISLSQSRSDLYPNLNFSDAQSLNSGYSLDPYTYEYTTQRIWINNASLNSSVTLFNGHLLQNTIKQNKLYYQVGMLEIEKVKNDILLYVLAGYMQVLMDYEAVNVAQSQIDATNTQVEQTMTFVKFGKLVRLNLFQIESQLASDKLTKVNAENLLQVDKLILQQLMDTPVRNNFDIEIILIDELLTQNGLTSTELNEISLDIMPQIKSAELRTEIAQFNIKMAQSAELPKLTLNGALKTGYSSVRSDELTTQLKNNFNQLVSLSLSVPIFNNFQAKNNSEIARVNVLKASLDETQTKNDLRKSIETVYTNQVSAAKKLVALKEQMDLEQRTYADMEKKYAVGVLSATDFLIEKNNYIRVSMALIQAKYDYALRVKMVDFYSGKPINFK